MSPKPIKGTRNTPVNTGVTAAAPGKFQLTSDVTLIILMAGLYGISLAGANLEQGLEALLIAGFMFVAFLVLAAFLNKGPLKTQEPLKAISYAFLGLSTLTLAWTLVQYLNVIDMAAESPLQRLLVAGLINGVLGLALFGAILAVKKISPAALFIRPGETMILLASAGGLLICIVLGILASYFMFDGLSLGIENFAAIVGAVVLFALLGGLVEELWFRGLLLSQAKQLLGESNGNIWQAVVFGVFETFVFYTIARDSVFLLVLFIIGAMTGYYWGRATLKSRSIASPILLHAGLYVLILLPIVVGLAA